MASKVLDDPRDPLLETKEVLPYPWYRDDMTGTFCNNRKSWICTDILWSDRQLQYFGDVPSGSNHGDTQQVRVSSHSALHITDNIPRNIAWAAIIFGISGIINSHSLRAKNSSASPVSSFL